MKGSELPSLIPLKVMSIYKWQSTETMHTTFEKQTRCQNPPLKKRSNPCSRHTPQPWQRHLYSKINLQFFHKQFCVAGRGNPILIHWAEKGWRSRAFIVRIWQKEPFLLLLTKAEKNSGILPSPQGNSTKVFIPHTPPPSLSWHL